MLYRNLEWFKDQDFVVITLSGSGRFLHGGYEAQSATYNQLTDLACEMLVFPEKPRKTLVTVLKMNCDTSD